MEVRSPARDLRRFHLSVSHRRSPAIRRRRIVPSRAAERDLEGQSVAVVGLGKSGRAAARLALARGALVIAIDQDKKLCPLENDPDFEVSDAIRTILGDVDIEILRTADIIVVSPGVPFVTYNLRSLFQLGKRVMSELDFAAEVLPNSIKVLAVTGTNGKSTAATFAGQILSYCGIEAFVGGNLGTPLSEIALVHQNAIVGADIKVAVVEVSSYQMEVPCKHFHPSVSMILNLTPDHLERHGSMRNYAACKCRLLSHMNNSKLGLIPYGNQLLNEAMKDYVDDFSLAWIGSFPGVKINTEEKVANLNVPAIGVNFLLDLGKLKAIGTHNYQNAAVAALAVLGLELGIDPKSVNLAIETLTPPPHRMELVHEDSRDVTWVNDSKATNVEATLAGLMGIKGRKSVILLGGLAKAQDVRGSDGFERLVETLNDHRCVITFGSSGKQIYQTLLANGLIIPCLEAFCLKDAVQFAREMAKHGDMILLSPGCASFDEFKSFEHRGSVFRELATLL